MNHLLFDFLLPMWGRAALFLMLAFLVVLLLRNCSKILLASYWRAAFAAVLLVIFGSFLPHMQLPILPSASVKHVKHSSDLASGAAVAPNPSNPPIAPIAPIDLTRAESTSTQASTVGESSDAAGTGGTSFIRRSHWSRVVVLLWAFGAGVVLLPLAVAGVRLHRLRRRAQVLELDRPPKAAGKPIKLLTHPDVESPFVAGFFRPAIYLPGDAAQWDATTRQNVIQHEAEHLRCRDPLYSSIARLCLALNWVNPLAWWAMARLHRSQELAADEVVLRQDGDRRGYAELLLRFARQNASRYPLGDLAHPMAQTSTLGNRIEHILEAPLAPKPKGTRTMSMVLLAAGVFFGLAAVAQTENKLSDWLDQNALAGFLKPTPAEKAIRSFANRGLCGLYNDYGGTFTLAAIESVLENDLYLSGPHKDGNLDVKNNKSFGHYNPAAIRELVEAGDRLLKNKAFVAATRPLYEKRMRSLILAFYEAYVHVDRNPEFEAAKQSFVKHLEGAGVPQGFGWELGWEFGKQLELEPWGDRMTKYETVTAVRFWLRRSIDGSDQEFIRAVMKLIQAYEPDYPLASLPPVENLEVKLGADISPNTVHLRILDANVPTEKLGIRILAPNGTWIVADRLGPLLEGKQTIKAEAFWKPFPPLGAPAQSLEIQMKGTLKEELDELINDLADGSFQKRQYASIIIRERGRYAKAYLQEKLNTLQDPEQIDRLQSALKGMTDNP